MEFLQDTAIWVFISFVVFCFIMWKFAKDKFLGLLDKRIEEIKKDIQNAENLHIEAQELLAQFQRKQRDSAKEAETIIENAKQHSKEIQKSAELALEDMITRREVLHKERLSRMEDQAVQDIRNYAADLALQATKEIIAHQLDEKTNIKIVDDSIKNISKLIAA